PSFELAMANRLARIFLLLMVGFFRLPGLMIGLIVVFLFYSTTRSFGIPYLWPLLPTNWAALKSIMVRSPVPMQNVRPSVLRPLDPIRQAAPARKPRSRRKEREKERDAQEKLEPGEEGFE